MIDGGEYYRAVGMRIANARDLAGMTQAELAKRIGFTRSSVANIEAGRQRMLSHKIYATAEALNVTAAYLLGEALPESSNVRPSWDAVFMSTADAIARRSRCVRARVGAVLATTDHRVIAASYNGPPHSWSGAPNDDTRCVAWCARGRGESTHADYVDCPAAHAEMNAIARTAEPTTNATLYVTTGCCFHCAKVVANTGIHRVVARWNTAYREPGKVMEFLTDCGLTVDDFE